MSPFPLRSVDPVELLLEQLQAVELFQAVNSEGRQRLYTLDPEEVWLISRYALDLLDPSELLEQLLLGCGAISDCKF